MIRRNDFREVTPTADELARYAKRHRWMTAGKRPAVPMAEHKVCGTRIWYSGIGIGSHLRACPGRPAPLHMPDHLRTDDLPTYLRQKGDAR